MIAAWMLYSVVVTVLIGLAGLSIEGGCRRLGWPLRWVWCGVLVAALALTLSGLARLGEPTTSTLLDAPNGEIALASSATPDDGRWRAEALIDGVRAGAASVAGRVYRTAGALGGDRGIAVAWSAASAALLLVMVWTLGRARSLRRRWRPARVNGVDLMVSPGSGPAVIGLLRPVIVVPAWLLVEPVARQRLVIAHEEEHLRARDTVLLTIACAAACVQPWNPAVWWVLRRLRLAVELDCDRRVLSRGASPREYGMLLLEMAGRTRPGWAGAPALADSTSHLERRIMAMTERIDSRNGVRVAAAAAVGALLLGAAACTTDLPTAEAVESMDVAAAQQQAEVAGLVALRSDGAEPLYVIDGEIVDAATARALAPGDIASIEVVKGEAARRTMGEKATAGAVYVATVTGLPRKTAEQETPLEADPERMRRQQVERQSLMKAAVREPGTVGLAPLLIVDGKPSKDGMQSIDRASIERVEVVKGEAARRRFDDPRAAHGVILITTKKGGHQDR